MEKEIKKILDKLKDANWYDELDLTGTMWIELRWEETHLLLDYITNLQETIYKATQYYLSTLVQYEKEFKKMPDEAVMMFNLLEGNK